MSKNSSFFWPSYSDLLTSLFFIMLVLFVLSVGAVVRNVQATQAQLDKIVEIEDAVKELPEKYFDYREEYKKHVLKLDVQFRTSRFRIEHIVDTSVLTPIIDAGKEIEKIVTKFNNRVDINVQYLVIVEGQSSRIPYNLDEYRNNDVLSYQRALTLKKYWEQNGININALNNCELIIAGSGEGGVPRDLPDDEASTKNQRFLIHIIPKPGIIDKKN